MRRGSNRKLMGESLSRAGRIANAVINNLPRSPGCTNTPSYAAATPLSGTHSARLRPALAPVQHGFLLVSS